MEDIWAAQNLKNVKTSVECFICIHTTQKSLYTSFNGANYDILPENITGLSIFNITIEFPSTGDLTIPTICRFCSHGALLFNRTLANRAAHFERPCL